MNDPYICRINAGRVTTLKTFLKRLYRMLLAFFLSFHNFGMQVLVFFYKIFIMQQLTFKKSKISSHSIERFGPCSHFKKIKFCNILRVVADFTLKIQYFLKSVETKLFYGLPQNFRFLKVIVRKLIFWGKNLKGYIGKVSKYRKNANNFLYRHFEEV